MNFKPGSASRWRSSSTPGKKPPEEKLAAGIPLAKVIKRELVAPPEIVMLSHQRSLGAEKFRRLRTTLDNEEHGCPQVIVVTSPGPAEGKSMVSLNLALALAAEKRGEVILLDADLRRPSIQDFLSPPPNLGLSDILEGKIELDHAVLSLKNSPLKIIPAGAPPREPAELIASDHAKELFSTLRERFQRIIIDTPPIVPFSDADVLGSLSDGFLLVARSGQTEKAAYLRALSLMTSSRILGTVLNDVSFSLADWNLQYDKYYHAYYDGKRKQ